MGEPVVRWRTKAGVEVESRGQALFAGGFFKVRCFYPTGGYAGLLKIHNLKPLKPLRVAK